MVERDMIRLRPALLLVVVIAAIALAAPHSALGSSESSHADQHAAVVTANTAVARAVADRAPQPLLALAVLFGGLAAAALLRARHDRLIGRRLRRLHDAGHDWRSLLLGAPPALA